MSKVNLVNETNQVLAANDGIVIRKFIAGIEGGRVLDMTGYTAETIPAGVVVITDGNGTYKPLLPSSGSYTLPSGYSYVGVVACTVLASKPAVSIMVDGIVNDAAAPYVYTSAVKSALSHIIFTHDGTDDIVEAPEFSPASWELGASLTVELACATTGASIYYTTDGSAPTSASTLYDATSKITLSATTTVKAIAYKTGMIPSEVVSKTYTKP
jgi:hypothetical protein